MSFFVSYNTLCCILICMIFVNSIHLLGGNSGKILVKIVDYLINVVYYLGSDAE